MRRTPLYSLLLTALFTSLICVSSWIQIPFAVPFTLQTFAIYFALLTLGGVRGLLSIIIYITLGALGLPVFSGFTGGVGALLQPSGGFIIGFIIIGCVYCIFERLLGQRTLAREFSLVLGTLGCYAVGLLFFVLFHTDYPSPGGFLSAGAIYVLPFVIPDGVKLCLALILSKKVKGTLTNHKHRS